MSHPVGSGVDSRLENGATQPAQVGGGRRPRVTDCWCSMSESQSREAAENHCTVLIVSTTRVDG